MTKVNLLDLEAQAGRTPNHWLQMFKNGLRSWRKPSWPIYSHSLIARAEWQRLTHFVRSADPIQNISASRLEQDFTQNIMSQINSLES